MAQGDVANAKDDTRFYGEDGGSGLSDLATDLSHQADDVSVGTNSIYESGAQSRWNVTGTACWELDVDMDNADTGYLYSYETAGSGVRLELASGGVVSARVDSTEITNITVPDLGPLDDRVVISWSVEPNPLTTGASDALRSELRAWNVDHSSYVQSVVTHAAPTSISTTAIWLARTTGGSAAFSGSTTRVRFSAGRFHPASEAREDLVATTTAPSLTLETRKEVPVPTRASGIAAHDYFAGPIYMAVGAGLDQQDLRQAGFVLNEQSRDAPDLDETFTTTRSISVPDAAGYTMLGQYLAYRPIPKTCNRLKVRVHVQAWRDGGAGDDDNIVIRIYSMNRPPDGLANANLEPAWDRRFQAITVNADHGSGTTGGAWFTFSLLRVVRADNGFGTWLGLAFDVQDAGGAGSTADQRWRVRAWTVEPGLELVDGDLPLL